MFNYREWNRINRLLKDGNQFLNNRGIISEISQIRIWLAAVSDTVLARLPAEGSKLGAQFEELLKFLKDEKKDNNPDEKLEENKEIKQKEIKDIVRRAMRILEYTRGLPELDNTSSQKPSENKNPLNLAEVEQNELEREIRFFISEQYFRSWWFRIPIIILGITVVFAILGVIQINNFKISVQEITDKAVERAKQDINAEVETIRSDLKEYAGGEEKIISSDAATYRKELEQQKAQAVQVLTEMTTQLNDLNPKVASLEKRQETLENRIMPLERAFEIINQGTERGLWFDAVAILNNSLIVVGISFLISCFALIVAWRFRKR